MNLSLSPALRRPRLAVALSALVLGALVLALAASSADAGTRVTAVSAKATGTCDRGDMCMWNDAGFFGGLYEWSGNDSNLGNDRFENQDTGTVVSNHVSAVYNNGYGGGYDDVVAYDGTGYGGAHLCVPNRVALSYVGAGWNDRISSYRWVTSC